MNTLWHKVWADLWLTKSRSFLAILSIAVGVFCVGALYGMIDLQLSKMDAAHRQSLPSHINLILRSDADLSVLTQIKALPGVADVDLMTPLSVRFKQTGDSDWRLGTLIIRPDFNTQKFDRTTLQAGSWPTNGQIAMENLSAEFTRLKIGDAISLETSHGNQTKAITGIVRHPFVKPPKFGGQVHFFADQTTAGLFAIPSNTFRQVLVQITPPYSSERTRQIAANIRNVLAERQVPVNVTLLQDPDKHWGRPFLAGVNRVLQIMALASLALASVLILNTISAHMTQQTEQIGVMKALGAKTWTIAQLYLIETLLMAVLAIMLAIPPSLFGAYFSSCRLLALFNIDCGGFAVSPRSIGFMILGGLLAPLLAALPAILRGATMNVRMAMASYGLATDFGYNLFDRGLEKLAARFLPTLYAAALGNLFRRKARWLLTQSVLIIAGIVFLVLMSLIASVNLTLDNETARSRYALRVGFSSDQPTQKVIAATQVPAKNLELWRRLPITLLKNNGSIQQKGSLGLQVLALPANTTLYQPLIESGRWLQAGDAGQRVLVLSADTAQLNNITVGDTVQARLGASQQDWQVIGLYRWLAVSSYSVEPVYAPLATVENLSQHQDLASLALIAAPINTLSEEADYLRKLKQRFQDHGIQLDVYSTLAKLEQRQFARNQFNPVIGTLFGLAAMIACVSGIGLSGAVAISVLQRTREIGVLRAIGAPSTAIFRLFLMEGWLHVLCAWALTVPLAYLAAKPISEELGKTMLGIQLDFVFDAIAVLYWLGILLMLAFLAAYWPAKKAAQLTVKESLGH